MQELEKAADAIGASWLSRQDAWGNTSLRWLIVLAAALVGVAILKLVRVRAMHHLVRLQATDRVRQSERGAGDWLRGSEDLVRRTKTWFFVMLAAYVVGGFLKLPAGVSQALADAMIVALVLQAAIWGDALLDFAVARRIEERKDVNGAAATTLGALALLGRTTIWTAAGLLVMANLGINVTALIAGFGIGGIAVALAAQNILSDLFASASIVLDRPFVLGDLIVVDDKTGTVERIGLKTTRIRSVSGEQLVFSNADLLKSRIHNFQRMSERRAAFTLNVALATPHEKLATIPALIRGAVEEQPQARFDRAHFARLGPAAMAFDAVYYVNDASYSVYMDVQQAINLAVVRRLAEEGVELAK